MRHLKAIREMFDEVYNQQRFIDLSHAPVHASYLKYLSRDVEEVIIVGIPNITGGLKFLLSYPKLRKLDLAGSYLEEEDLRDLAEHPNKDNLELDLSLIYLKDDTILKYFSKNQVKRDRKELYVGGLSV
jgi:hypothetical protein